MECENQERLLLQFHITGNCNLRCKHCYRTEGDAEPLSYEDVVRVVEQFKALPQAFRDLPRPEKTFLYPEAEAEALRQPALDEWLSAFRR